MQTVEKQVEKAQHEQASDKPLYVTLKDYVRSRVETGEWAVGHRVPSENELVELLGREPHDGQPRTARTGR